MNKAELEKNYRDTTYSIFIDDNKYDIKIDEVIPSAVSELIDKKSAVILTAYNPRSQAFSSQENKSRNNYLRVSLIKNNYSIFDAVGQGNDSLWPSEDSFFIIGLTKDKTEKLALEYGQYAYVWLVKDKPASLVFSNVWD